MIYLVVFPSLSLVKQFHKIHTNKRKLTLRDCQKKALSACTKDQLVVNISMCTGSGKSYVISNLLQGKVSYYATEGTLRISRIDLDSPSGIGDMDLVILTTYVSAPRVYDFLYSLGSGLDTYVFHDEAHHIEGPTYKREYDTYCENGLITKAHNFSATLPEEYTYDYTYPLLRGIQDGVVRDFYTMVMMCSTEDNEASFVEIVEKTHSKLIEMGQRGMRLLVYTSQANTENDVESEGGTSVKSFLEFFGGIASERGWWMKGLHNDTMRDKDTILREFEANSGISILVSCRTLSEGVDLRNANAMLPWDPSVDSKTNIQRIGRVVRLYKDDTGKILPKEKQTPSLVVIPVYLEKKEYVSIKDDPKKLHDKLHKDINEGMRGPFAPLMNVTAALKSELTLEDADLFRKVSNYPSSPKSGTFTGNVIEVLSKNLKKTPRKIVEEMIEIGRDSEMLDDDTCEKLDSWVEASCDDKEGEWEEIEDTGSVMDALVSSQDLTLMIEQDTKGEPEVFGSGETLKILERKSDGSYKVSKRKKETKAEKKAKEEVKKRISVCKTESVKVILGLGDDVISDEKTLIHITTRIEIEGESDYVWEMSRQKWETFYERYNIIPNPTSEDYEEKRIGEWQDRQINNRRNNIMRCENINKLTQTKGWIWASCRNEWSSLLKAIEYVKIAKEISCPERDLMNIISPVKRMSQNVLDKREVIIGSWLFRQRKAKKMDAHEKGTCILFPLVEDYLINECRLNHWLNITDPEELLIDKAVELINLAYQIQKEYNIDTTKERNILTTDKPSEVGGETPIKKFIDNHNKNINTNKHPKLKEIFKKKNLLWWFNVSSNEEKQLQRAKEIIEYAKKINETYKGDRNILTEDQPKQNKNEKQIYNFILNRKRARHNKIPPFKLKQPRYYESVERLLKIHDLLWWLSDDGGGNFTINNRVRKNRHAKKLPQTGSSKPSEHQAKSSAERIKSQMEIYHKKFKSMNSSTYAKHIKEHRGEWEEYHQIADHHDKSDSPEHSPHERIANYLHKRFSSKDIKILDAGCGMDRLRDDPRVSHLDWTSVDAVALSERVIEADIGNLGTEFKNDTYDCVVLNRALWARKPDHLTQLKELKRVLKQGGILVSCESKKKWIVEETIGSEQENQITITKNILESSMLEVGFSVIGRGSSDDDSVWLFTILQKPVEGGI